MSKTTWLGGRYGVVLLSLVVAAAFIGIWSHQVWRGQERALLTAEQIAANLVHVLEDSNNRSVQAVDLILTNVTEGVKPGGWAQQGDGNRFLQALLDEAPQVREVAFIDVDGRVTDISRRGALPQQNFSQEPYFQAARAGTLPPLYVGAPRPGRLLGGPVGTEASSQHWHMIFAQAAYDDQGAFAGVAVAVINPGIYHEQIAALDIGKKGVVTFYRYDGTVLVRGGASTFEIGSASDASSVLFSRYLPEREWGTFRDAGQIVSYRATTRWPLLIAVNLDEGEALSPWRQDAQDFSIIMAGAMVVLLILAVVLYGQRAAAERDARRLTLQGTALQTTANMVLITDIDARIVWVNDAFTKRFGYSLAEAVGQTPKMLKSGLVPASRVADLWNTILAGQTWNGEFINRCKNGTLLTVNQTISPIVDEDGQITHFVGIHDDITKRKEAELQLREAKLNAESANKVKTQFLANMSHELRTPLNAVLGFIDIMRLELYGPLGHDKYRDYSQDIHASATHLLTLISDILDVSKIEAGKMDLAEDRIILADLADSCYKLMRHRAGENGVALSTELPDDLPDLDGDEVRVKQIVLNLLTNAIKFTPKGGKVVLAMDRTPDNAIVIRTEDTGIGIAPNDMAQILEPFGQAGDANNTVAHEGVGLGLYLVKVLAEMHDGEIDIVSTVGEGTVVTVRFPASRSLSPETRSRSV